MKKFYAVTIRQFRLKVRCKKCSAEKTFRFDDKQQMNTFIEYRKTHYWNGWNVKHELCPICDTRELQIKHL